MAEINIALKNVQIPPFTKDEILEKVKNLPPHIQSLSSQVAGHEYAIFKDTNTGYILKPVFDVRGIREEMFYRMLFDSKYDQNECLVKLRSFLPTYVNTQRINDVDFVTLIDLTTNMVNPSLMDVKMGTTTYDRNASPEKIKNESKKSQLSKKVGYRVLAFKKWKDNAYDTIDRVKCRNCSIEELEQIIKYFFEQPNDKEKTIELMQTVLNKLNEINDWFEKENIDLFEFIGTSLFFIYSFVDNKLYCKVNMIDFAHMFPLEGSHVNKTADKKDNNYLVGLRSFINVIKKLIEDNND